MPKDPKVNRLKQIVLAVVSVCLILGGIYLLLLVGSPNVKPLSTQQQQAFTPEEIAQKRIIIPKIAVKTDIFEGDQAVLNKGAWHRVPQNGNPEIGGNFVISAHRFVMSKTPGQTKDKSHFYNIDKLVVGDQVFIDWEQQRFEYKITKIYNVTPTQLEIEAPSNTPKLTIYTCTLAGSADGRVVVEAEPIMDS